MAAVVDDLGAKLRGRGFKADNKLRDRLDREAGEHPTFDEPDADARAAGAQPRLVQEGTGLRATGPYEVLGAFSGPDDVTVVVEQNTSVNPFEVDPAKINLPQQQPPVAIIDGPNGFRVACDPSDVDLVEAQVAAAGGDWSLMEQRDVKAALRRAGFEPEGDEGNGGVGSWVRGAIRLGPMLLMLLPSILIGRLLGLIWFAPPMVVTNATKKAWLDAWYTASALGAPSTVHFGLSTTTPAEDGTNVTEPSGNAYARVSKTAGTTDFPASTAADPTIKTNGTTITWPAATGSWGTVTHCTQHSASTGGSVQDWQALGASQAIGNGTTASIAASSWQSTLT